MKKSRTSGHRFSHGVKNLSDGSKYVGQLKDDKRDGQGIHTLANGDKYEGKWKDDKKMATVRSPLPVVINSLVSGKMMTSKALGLYFMLMDY